MSLCVFIQTEDSLIIGADTAVTTTINGENFRHRDGFRKLIQIDNFLIFVCGYVESAKAITNEFKKEKVKSIEGLERIVKNHHQEFMKKYPEKARRLTEERDTVLSVAAIELRRNGKVVSYCINTNKGIFTTKKRVGSFGQIHVVAGGFASEKALELAKQSYISKMKDKDLFAGDVIKEVFEQMSGDSIGGDLIYYVVDRRGFLFLKEEKINEVLRIKVLEEHISSGKLIAGTMTGFTIQTAASGARVAMTNLNDFSSYDFAGKRRITISPLTPTYGLAGLEFLDENEVVKGHIFSNTSLMGIVGKHDLTISSLTGETNFLGFLDFSNANGVNMPQKADAFAGITGSYLMDSTSSGGGSVLLVFSNGVLVNAIT